ncbi:MAG TPA: cell division protein FtsZ [Anaerolineaceae bacterium]|nr:cell division protein FtsZ [Anaerolineaceae bacterium]
MNLSMSSAPIHHTPLTAHQPVLKVLGMGGAGCNAVNRMIELGLNNIEFIAANTDHQALQSSLAPVKVQLGPRVTRGLGAGGRPETGEAAAEESYRELAAALSGADMVFLTAGMGGGTGTGSIPIAARVARSLGAVTIAIVTTPFSFEMGRRQRNAREGLAKLRPHTDTLITVPNDRLLYVAPKDLPMEMAFRLADDVLRQGIQGIAELITEPGLINVDFAHVRRLMQLGGGSLMSIGQAEGEGKARKAVEQALHHPLMETVSLDSSAGMIVNFTGGSDLTFLEVADALNYLQEQTGNRAEIIPGVINNEAMEDRAQVILIVTGLGATPIEEALPGAERLMPTRQPIQQPAAQPQPVMSQPAQNIPQAPLPVQRAVEFPVEAPQMELSGASVNLDIPAFMRRRVRYAG